MDSQTQLEPQKTSDTKRSVMGIRQPRVVQQRLARRGRHRLLRLNTLGWVVIDCTVAVLAIVIGYVISPYVGVLDASGVSRHLEALPCSISYSVLLLAMAHVAGLHDPRVRGDVIDVIVRCFTVICLAMATLSLLWSMFTYVSIGRYVLISAAFLSLVGMASSRLLAWQWTKNFAQTICFMGDDAFCSRVAQFVDDHPLPFNVRTALEFDQDTHADDLSVWAISHGIDEIVFDASSASNKERCLLDCLDAGVMITPYADFIEENYCFVPVDQIDANWLFSARLDLAHPYYTGFKRATDVALSFFGLIITSPAILIAAILIKLESRGPAFYSQVRVGRFNRHFRIYKLRTMVTDAESDGAQWAKKNDSRITPIGGFLRKTRLDELPQFWNVLKGEMSLVGPRPERPEFVEMLSEKVPFYVQRHLVKPGLTGWAQINYPYGASVEDAYNKLTYDLFYVKRASVGLDLQIFLRTVGAMMKGSR